MEDKVKKAILKRALGYSVKEVQEEFSLADDGGMTLTKRKVTDKYLPPDNSALKTYLELSGVKNVDSYSDEQLQAEKERLVEELLKSKQKKQRSLEAKEK